MYVVLAKEPLTGPGSFQTLPAHQLHSNSAILHNYYISLLSDLWACVHVKKNWCHEEAIVLKWVVWTASWHCKPGKKQWDAMENAIVCAKTILEESHKCELAHLKKGESATGCVVRHENTQRWAVGCYNGLYVSCFGDYERLFALAISIYRREWLIGACAYHLQQQESMHLLYVCAY